MKIITSEGLTPSLLADEIGVQRSGISHILSGRNYPSFDFLQKLLTRFPKLNAEWFILGQGSMYQSTVTNLTDLFTPSSPESKEPVSPTLPDRPQILSSGDDHQKETPGMQPEIPLPAKGKKIIEKMIILYTDKTFASYFPE